MKGIKQEDIGLVPNINYCLNGCLSDNNLVQNLPKRHSRGPSFNTCAETGFRRLKSTNCGVRGFTEHSWITVVQRVGTASGEETSECR